MSFGRVSFRVLNNTLGASKTIIARSFSCANRQAMRFVQYENSGCRGLGIQLNDGGDVVSLSGADPTIPVDMVSFLHSEYSIEKIEK